jgi:hypothetical protein
MDPALPTHSAIFTADELAGFYTDGLCGAPREGGGD